MCIWTLKFLSTHLVLNFNWSGFPSSHPVLSARKSFPASFIWKTPPLGSSSTSSRRKPCNERQFEYSKHSMARCCPYQSPMWPAHIETSGAILNITSLTLLLFYIQPGQTESYSFQEGTLQLREKSDDGQRQRGETDSISTAIIPGF